MTPVHTTCLLGNGVSVAYNPTLSVPTLTADLFEKFRAAGASDPGRALSGFAERLSTRGDGQFEALLGPLSATAAALPHLRDLAEIAAVAGATPKAALDRVVLLLEEIHRLGLAITLDHIAERTIGAPGQWDRVSETLGRELANLGPASMLTVATLNYDGLTHSALLDAWRDAWLRRQGEVCDLAEGMPGMVQRFEIVPGHILDARPIRDFDNLLRDRAALLQLHGSLGWLRRPEDQSVWKFELQDLRGASYWRALAENLTPWRPAVVLTDRKERTVAAWPFSLAYEIFRDRLLRAPRWLIAGYGFGDEPVNRALKSAATTRGAGGQAPEVLVIDMGGAEDAVQARASTVLGLSRSHVTASVEGVPASFDTEAWSSWAGQDL